MEKCRISNLDIKKKLENNSCYEPNTGCMLWLGSTASHGYGQLSYKGKMFRAHRLSYIIHNNLDHLPSSICVCHKCDTVSCINPEHLFVGSQMENMMDAKTKGRMFIKKEKCKNGHLMSGENIRFYSYVRKINGRTYEMRICRKCEKINGRNKYNRKKTENKRKQEIFLWL